jgi:hypothetical protein
LKKEKERKKEKEEEKEKLQESQQIKGKSIFWEEKNTSTSKFLWRGENHWESFLNSFGPSFSLTIYPWGPHI